MRIRNRTLHWSLRLGQCAFAVFVMGGAILGTVLLQKSQDSLGATLRKLHPISRADLLLVQTDTVSLIEGRISRANEVLSHAMVAYERSRSVRDLRDDTVWVPESRQTPPIVVELADGVVEVLGDYQLGGTLGTQTDGGMRYAGLAVGDEVVVIGKHLPGGPIVRLEASQVLQGTRSALIQSRVNYWGIGLGVALMALGLGIMAWLLQQGYSPFGKRNTGRA